MSKTFYNLTIARNIQLSRNEKEKSPQTLDEIQLPQRESENDRPITERLDWRGGDIRDFYPVYVFAAAVDEGRRVGWFSVGRGVVPCQPQRPLTMTSRNAKGDETVARRSTRA